MTERLHPEREHGEAKKLAMRYLKSGTELSEKSGLRDLLGLEDDFGPLLFSACAQQMIDYDLQEKLLKLQKKAEPSIGNPAPARLGSSVGRKEREILMLGFAAEILCQVDKLYIEGMFDPNNIPPQVPQIPDAVHELFVMLVYQTTTPQQSQTTRERLENWGTAWRTRLNSAPSLQ